MIDFIRVIALSLVAIFIGHQLFKYVKSTYLDTNATRNMLRESKQMYEDIASHLNNNNKQVGPNKKGNNVNFCEEENIVTEIPNRHENMSSTVTSLSDLGIISNLETYEYDTHNHSNIDNIQMQSELTNFINELSN